MKAPRAGLWGRLLGRGGSSDAALAELAVSVRELAAMQRKHAEQLKKIRESQLEIDARWQAAVDRWQKLAGEVHVRQARQAAKSQDKATERLEQLLRDSENYNKAQQKWRVIFSRQIDAMMRTLQLARMDLPHPFDITARRFRLRSQNEEDGIILALLNAAGVRDRRFVEIGCGRTGGNAALLAYECGWSGLMVDASVPAIDKVKRRFHHNLGVIAVAAEVSAANINTLLATHGFIGDLDLFSLDIDSYDYWVLEALEACSPRVLVLEYNAAFGPNRALTVPRDRSLSGAPSWYRGASLAALEQLARRKGYRLVACENSGVNAFFLRNDVAPSVPGAPAGQAFRPALDRRQIVETSSEGEGPIPADPAFPLAEV